MFRLNKPITTSRTVITTSDTPSSTKQLGSIDVLRRIWKISHPHRPQLLLAGLLGLAGAGATVGLLAGSGYVVDRAAFHPGLSAIAGILAVVEVMAFLRGPLRYKERLVAHDAALHALTYWRLWLYDILTPLAPGGLRTWRNGDLLNRVIDDTETLQDLYLRALIPVLVAFAASILSVIVVGIILPIAGLILAGCLLIALIVPAILAHPSPAKSGEAAEIKGRLSADVVELIQGASDLIAFDFSESILTRIEKDDARLRELSRMRALRNGAASGLIGLCTGLAVIGVLAVGVVSLRSGSHQIDPVMLAALVLATLAGFEAVPATTLAAGRLEDLVAAGRRLLELEAVQSPAVDPDEPMHLESNTPLVSLRNAKLRYAPDLPWALDGFDLEVKPGDKVAIIGPSGAGKSSVVNVLLRFCTLNDGLASLDLIPLESLEQKEVRHALSLLDQHAHLFSGSIRSNIVLARPDANDSEIADVVRIAQLESWVRSLPDGLDTTVGEDSKRISGGQRRRIALARALLAGGSVLVLDEPTAGLDRQTGEALMEDVVLRVQDKSIILVTHREQDALDFDSIIVMEEGRQRR